MESKKEEFVNKCIKLCSMTDEDILKQILHDGLNTLESENDTEATFPENCDIMTYKPTRSTFADFAIHVCKNHKMNKHNFLRNMICNAFDNIIDETNKRKVESVDNSRRTRSRRTTIRRNNTLPGILSVFTCKSRRGEFEAIHDIENIINLYFVDHVRLSDTVYGDESNNYVVIVSDYVDSKWISNGRCNILTWKPSLDKDLFTKITNSSATVHIIRKRNEEFRYMGKRESINQKDESMCIMTIG